VFPDVDEAQANGLWKKELRRPAKEERDEEEDESH